jgi:cytosine/adenosine deaminase-related metal-dependent hydrolase
VLEAATGVAALAAARPAGAAPQPRASRPLLIRGADLLTMDPKLGELQAMDVVVRGGKIAGLGKSLTVADADVVEAKDMILMPGMCDGHRHTWETFERGAIVKFEPRRYDGPSVFRSGYQEWKLRSMAALTPEDHYLAEYVGGLQAIESGVTSVLDNANGQHTVEHAVAAAQGLRDSGVGGWHTFQLGVNIDFKPGDTVPLDRANFRYMTPAEDRHWAAAEALQKQVFTDSSAPLQLSLGPSTVLTCPIERVKAEYARCRAMGVQLLAVHVMPPTYGIRAMHAAGLLGPDFHASHANQIDDEELTMMRETGAMLCSTNMGEFPFVAHGMNPPVFPRAREAGVPVGIGIDVVTGLTLDYFEHIRIAFWSLYLGDPGRKLVQGYSPTDLLDLATAGGARAIGLGDVTGSITVGKRADLVLLRTDRSGFATIGSLADRVVTNASLSDVDSVWIMGQARKRAGKMLGVDWAVLKARLAAAQARFRPLADSVKLV